MVADSSTLASQHTRRLSGRSPRARISSLAASIVLAALVLTGCSTSPTSADGADSSDSLLPAAEGTTEYPFTLETAWGETVLEERPERIAVVTSGGVDTQVLLSLGVTPTLASDLVTRSVPTMEAISTEIETLYESDFDNPYPLETIAANNPDLIIATNDDLTDVYDDLSEIAPVLAHSDAADIDQITWQDRIALIGEALDLSDDAANVVSDTDEFFANFREEYPEFDGLTASKITVYGGDYGMYYDAEATTTTLLSQMGFASNPVDEQFLGNDGDISAEMIGLLQSDVLIIGYNEGTDIDSLLTGQSLYQTLPAVQNGHSIVIESLDSSYVVNDVESDGELGWDIARSGPLSSPWAATRLAEVISPLF